MANPVHSLADRMRDVRLSVVLALAMLALAAIDAIAPTFTPALLLDKAHHPVNRDALLTFLVASPGGLDVFPAAAILYYFGPEVEKKLGGWKFVTLFVLGALGGIGVELLLPAGPLGGAAGGALFCAWLSHTSAGSRYRRTLRTAMVGDAGSWSSLDWDAIPRDGLHALTVEELDRVRAKVESQGIRSLSEDERAFVHRMRLRVAE